MLAIFSSSCDLNKSCGAGHGTFQKHLGRLNSTLDFILSSLMPHCLVLSCVY